MGKIRIFEAEDHFDEEGTFTKVRTFDIEHGEDVTDYNMVAVTGESMCRVGSCEWCDSLRERFRAPTGSCELRGKA